MYNQCCLHQVFSCNSFFLEDQEEEESSAVGYQPMMDLTRFQRLIQELDKDNGTLKQDSGAFPQTARRVPAEQAMTSKSRMAGEWEEENQHLVAHTFVGLIVLLIIFCCLCASVMK